VAGRGKTSNGRKQPAGKAAARPGSSPDSPEDRVIDTALRLAAAEDWRAVGMARLAAEASVDLATLYELFPVKAAVLVGLMRRVDRAVLAAVMAEPVEGSPRDRLFDVLMRRFDALRPFRAGLAAIAASGVEPLGGLALVGPFQRAMAWMLEAAGLASTGLTGRIRIAGLAVVYAQAFRVWLDDESADLGKTMAALDRGLAQAERWASTVPGVRSQRSGPAPDPALEQI
jgi:AcrR family transcriptional regulator